MHLIYFNFLTTIITSVPITPITKDVVNYFNIIASQQGKKFNYDKKISDDPVISTPTNTYPNDYFVQGSDSDDDEVFTGSQGSESDESVSDNQGISIPSYLHSDINVDNFVQGSESDDDEDVTDSQNDATTKYDVSNFVPGEESDDDEDNDIDSLGNSFAPQLTEITEMKPKYKQLEKELMSVKGMSDLHKAVATKQTIEVARILSDNSSNLNITNSKRQTGLHTAVLRRADHILNMLIKHGLNVNSRDIDGMTALHFAAVNGDLKIAKLLISNGADVNLVDNLAQTPLHHAALNSRIKMTKFLISEGADVTARNIKGKTPYMISSNLNVKKVIAKANLKSWDPRFDANDLKKPFGAFGNYNALSSASRSNEIAVVKLLVSEYGYNVNEVDDHGTTPLIYAAIGNSLDVAKYLVQKGADVNAISLGGHTALHFASRKSNREMVEFLVQENADVNAKTSTGLTALDFAKNDIYKFLKAHNGKSGRSIFQQILNL